MHILGVGAISRVWATGMQAFYCQMNGLDVLEIQMHDGHVCYGYGLD